jgi:hypothetical protein
MAIQRLYEPDHPKGWPFYRSDWTGADSKQEFQENLSDTEMNTSDEERDHFVGMWSGTGDGYR